MTRPGAGPPQRTLRGADTLELWDPRGSVSIADWRRAALGAESALQFGSGAVAAALAVVNRRLPAGEAHEAPRRLAWLPLHLDAAAAGWRWGLVVDERLVLPARRAAPWIESGAPPPQAQRAGAWWRITRPDGDRWEWYIAAATLEAAVRRALHGTAPIDTTVVIARAQIRHQLLVAVVDATPPGRPPVRLTAQDLGGPRGPAGGWGCLLARDLDTAEALCA